MSPRQIKVYTKVPCPYCVTAKRLLSEKGLAFEEIDLTERPDELQKLKKETSWRTVPMIFIDGQMIGGYTELKELEEAGKLD